jgi:hypothetical protein
MALKLRCSCGGFFGLGFSFFFPMLYLLEFAVHHFQTVQFFAFPAFPLDCGVGVFQNQWPVFVAVAA